MKVLDMIAVSNIHVFVAQPTVEDETTMTLILTNAVATTTVPHAKAIVVAIAFVVDYKT